MSESIHIALEEVRETAGEIQRLSTEMDNSLQAIKQEMDALQNTWISEGASEIQERFQTFARRFAQQKEEIDSYVRFLYMTASSYDALESSIKNNANGLQV